MTDCDCSDWDWLAKTFFLLILIFLIIFALYWEYQDYQRLMNMPDINEIPEDQKLQYLQSLACYNYNNGPTWREALFATVIIGLIFLFIFGCSFEFRMGVLVLFIIWVVFYGILALNSYHIQRIICNKADPPYFYT